MISWEKRKHALVLQYTCSGHCDHRIYHKYKTPNSCNLIHKLTGALCTEIDPNTIDLKNRSLRPNWGGVEEEVR
jgi:hypothetical protein